MRVNLLFMSPIILKYLPFCAFLLPVSLQCDKMLQASSLNPFLLPPISSFISQTSYKSLLSAQFLLLHFRFPPTGSSLYRAVPLGVMWLFDHVSVTLLNILFRSMFVCVFDLLYVWLLSLKSNNTCVCVLLHFLYICLATDGERSVLCLH